MSPSRVLFFRVAGTPEPKGSTKSYGRQVRRKDGRTGIAVVTTSDNPKAKGWQDAIAAQALAARHLRQPAERGLLTGGVSVIAVFYLRRPKSVPRREGEPTRKPDLDKLLRPVLDALTGVLWRDDAQVVMVTGRKFYVPAGRGPFVDLWVGPSLAVDRAGPGADLFAAGAAAVD